MEGEKELVATMKIESVLVKKMRLSLLRKLLVEQETNIRHYENLVVDALNAQRQTAEKIEELEAELEAHEIITQ